jgi:hypothetical protein
VNVSLSQRSVYDGFKISQVKSTLSLPVHSLLAFKYKKKKKKPQNRSLKKKTRKEKKRPRVETYNEAEGGNNKAVFEIKR